MLEQSIKNPSLIPDWFVFSSAGKVTGVKDVNGFTYEFVGSSEKGEDGQTPLLRINSANNYKWEVSYDGTVWNEVQVSPAASGMVGPQGETGPSGNSIVLKSAVPAEGGIQVTLAWGDSQSETSAFLIPSGTPGSSYTFDQTTTSGDGTDNPIGVNTDVIATKDDLDEKVDKPSGNEGYKIYDAFGKEWTDVSDYLREERYLQPETAEDYFVPENGLSAEYRSGAQGDMKYHFGIATSGIDANKQYAWTTSGWKEVTAQGSIAAGTDLVLDNGVMKVNTNGTANEAGMAFVEGQDNVASGAASHAEGKLTSAFSPYSHIEGYKNGDNLIPGLIGANHTEGAYNQTSGVYAHVEGHANKLYGYGVHMQGGYNEFTIRNTSADRSDPDGRWNIWGISIEGMANKTTSEPTSGTGETKGYVHGGILKVIGNGTRTGGDEGATEQIDRSDALILYRDGSMWVQGPISANGVELAGTPKLPLNIGLNNNVVTAGNGTIGVIGNNSYSEEKSFVISVNNTSAFNNSFAFGADNYAYGDSLVGGWMVSACNRSFAAGHRVSADNYSIAVGNGNPNSQLDATIADNYSIAVGDCVQAHNYSQAFGRGLIASGNSNGKGMMVIGGWNKTMTNALFVVGNGTSNGSYRNDAMVVGVDGGVSATRFANKNGTDTVGAYSGINNVQVYPAGTSTSNFPDDGVLRIVLE